MTRSSLLLLTLLLPACAAHRQPLTYWSDIRTTPEPMAVHVLKVDLHDKSIQVDVVIADDPDGAGPAEAALTNPIELARRAKVIAAVNANAFAGVLRDSTGKIDSRWREGLPVNIAGGAIHDGIVRSPGADSAVVDEVFGVDANGRAYIGPAAGAKLEEAVNAWSFRMLQNGAAIPKPGGVRHPRTTVGIDSTGRWLYIVVVDGRQDGYSVGMTPRELSDLMIKLGAYKASNLDGGGSSIMLMASDTGLKIMNRPSGGQPRPVPVMLTIRRR